MIPFPSLSSDKFFQNDMPIGSARRSAPPRRNAHPRHVALDEFF